MIKESVLQEDVRILNVYMSHRRVSNYDRQTLIELQGEIDGSTLMVGDFDTPLSEVN